ncbi:MAG: DUF3592 domain-containing protein [Clostridiales bacterium]|nr:DUF3592 domain-containing protein [Clostridiales bacterium]
MDKTMMIVIAVVAVIVVFAILNSIKNAARRRIEKEFYERMTGRATGNILSRNVTKERVETSRDDEEEKYEYVCYVTYEFVVNGITYKGSGEGARSGSQKKQQTICYDPADPNSNCTEYYYKKKTSSHILSTLITLGIVAAVLVFAYMKSKGKI